MEELDVEIIPSSRSDGVLLWCPREKHLYIKKSNATNGREDWICYQQMLIKNNKSAVDCKSRLSVDRSAMTGTRKKILHEKHDNHERVYKDLVSRNKINSDLVQLKALSDGLSIDIRSHDVFTRELAK